MTALGGNDGRRFARRWAPAFAGETGGLRGMRRDTRWIPAFAGMTGWRYGGWLA